MHWFLEQTTSAPWFCKLFSLLLLLTVEDWASASFLRWVGWSQNSLLFISISTEMLYFHLQFTIYASYSSVIAGVFLLRGLFSIWKEGRRSSKDSTLEKTETPEYVEHKFWMKAKWHPPPQIITRVLDRTFMKKKWKQKNKQLKIIDCKHCKFKSFFFIQNKCTGLSYIHINEWFGHFILLKINFNIYTVYIYILT